MFSKMSTALTLPKTASLNVLFDSEFSFYFFDFEDIFSFLEQEIDVESGLLVFVL